MRELKREEKDLWTVVYDVCVRTPEWLKMEPFDPGRLHSESLKKSRSEEEIIELYNSFKDIFKSKDIDFETNVLMKQHPLVKNRHIYYAIEKYILYFEKEFNLPRQ